ncbi:FecR family protein [Mucilaginibacter yixingensis]|uniref:FecR family protein n=1 Tax=Mucilaginibacter yixingensis TaxID=1295612 RepID=A0A2T5J6J6_9SPHI|nr:FecR domain-containing protein [Mucilaginibacter yixingensis]PTQ94167.1 FecR family protein [Mucilaginibacter yixingensis]
MNQEKFVRLITKELVGELTFQEAKELEDLLKEDSINQARYNIIREYVAGEQVAEKSNMQLLEKVRQKIAAKESQIDIAQPKRKSGAWLAKVAAMLLVAIATAILFYTYPTGKKPELTHLVNTPNATRKKLILSDGTQIVLNADSKIQFPDKFEGDTREVRLTGEAYFDVHHDPAHPFIIHTGKMDVKVLGTAFNIKAYADDNFSETTLLRGKIQVTLRDRPSDIITLKPTEKLVVNYSSPADRGDRNGSTNVALPKITYLQKKDSMVVETSWLSNKIVFQDEEFAELAKKLERTYNVHIEFENERVKQLVFTGIFEQENIEQALHAMSLISPFTYKINQNQIIVK